MYHMIPALKATSSVVFSVFDRVGQPSAQPILEQWVIVLRETLYPHPSSPLAFHTPSLWTTFCSLELPVLDMSCKWNPMIYVP